MPLPGESEIRAENARLHSERLRHFDHVLGFVLGRLGSNIVTNDVTTVETILGLITRSIKTARSAVLLLTAGLSTDATVLMRTLFEIRLALRFIGDNAWELKRNGKPHVVDPTRPMTPRFRALLYRAHEELEYRHFCDDVTKHGSPLVTPGLATISPERDEYFRQIRAEVGTAWIEVLSKPPRTYTGLPFREFVQSMDDHHFETQRVVLYRRASWATHGGDAHAHAFFAPEGFVVAVEPENEKTGIGLGLVTAHLVDSLRWAAAGGLALWTEDEVRPFMPAFSAVQPASGPPTQHTGKG